MCDRRLKNIKNPKKLHIKVLLVTSIIHAIIFVQIEWAVCCWIYVICFVALSYSSGGSKQGLETERSVVETGGQSSHVRGVSEGEALLLSRQLDLQITLHGCNHSLTYIFLLSSISHTLTHTYPTYNVSFNFY